MRKRSVSHSRSVSPPTKRAGVVRTYAEPQPSNVQEEQQPQTAKEPRLFVCFLDLSVSREEVKALFEAYGEVVDIFHKTNEKGGIAFITFDTLENAEKALECNGAEMNGKKIKVQFAKPRTNNGQRGNRNSFDTNNEQRNNFRQGGNRGQQRKKTCYKCSQEGHFAKDCTEPNENNNQNGQRKKTCFKCSKQGHFAKDCTESNENNNDNNQRKKTCFKCSKEGHFSRDCTEVDTNNREGGQRKKTCFKCSKEGHFANNCPQSNANNEGGERKKTCFKCSKEGHFANSCPEQNENNFSRERRPDNRERRSDNRERPNRNYPRRQRNFDEEQLKLKENIFPTGRVDYVNTDNVEDRFKIRESNYGKVNSIQLMVEEKPIQPKVARKRSASRSGSPVLNRNKANNRTNENIANEVKSGFEESKRANVSRSRSRSNDNKSNIVRRKRSPSHDSGDY